MVILFPVFTPRKMTKLVQVDSTFRKKAELRFSETSEPTKFTMRFKPPPKEDHHLEHNTSQLYVPHENTMLHIRTGIQTSDIKQAQNLT